MAIPIFPVVTLPPGSTSYTLVGLSAGQQYTAVVAHKEDPPSQGYTTPSQVGFTTGTTMAQCAAPDDPVAFALIGPHVAVPMYGFACYNNEAVPGASIVVQMAIETAPGSGTFGPWLTIDHIGAVPGAWALRQLAIPSDGCRRTFQAQATRAGTIPSAFTPQVTLMPGQPLAPADYPVAVPLELQSSSGYAPVSVFAPSGMTVAIVSSYPNTVPTDHDFDHMEYAVQPWVGGVAGPQQVVVGSSQGSDVIVAQAVAGGSYQITPITVSRGASGQQFFPGLPLLVTRNPGSQITVTVPSVSNNPHPTLLSTNQVAATFSLPFDTGTAYYAVYARTYSSAPSAATVAAGVESPNYSIAQSPFSLAPLIYPGLPTGSPPTIQPATLTLNGLSLTNQWMIATFVAYNNAGQRGSTTTIEAIYSGTAPPAAPTLSLGTFPGTGGTNGGTGPNGGSWNFPGWVGIKVTVVAPSTGDTVTLLRGTTQVGQHILTAADVSALACTIVDSTFTTAGTQTYTAYVTGTVSGGGNGATSAGFNVTLGTGYTLSGLNTLALTGSFTGGSGGAVTATAASDGEMPPTGGITIQWGTSNASGTPPSTWNTITTNGVSGQAYAISIGPSSQWMHVQAWVSAPGYTTSAVSTATKQMKLF